MATRFRQFRLLIQTTLKVHTEKIELILIWISKYIFQAVNIYVSSWICNQSIFLFFFSEIFQKYFKTP